MAKQPREEKIELLKKKLTLVNVSLTNASNTLKSGKVVAGSLIDDLYSQQVALKKQIELLESGEELPGAPESEPSHPETEETGMPERLRIKRPYTMTEAAIEQRRSAAQSPKKSEAMSGNKNAWKHGKYAQGHIERFIRPCKSTCPDYPCSIVDVGTTQPGEMCLDKQNILETFTAIRSSIKDNQHDDIAELMAMKVAGAMQVVEMLLEDIIRDNTIVKSEKINKDGDVIGYEIKSHPSLDALPKLMRDLNLSLGDLHVTPKAREKQKTEEKGLGTLAEMLGRVGGKKESNDSSDD